MVAGTKEGIGLYYREPAWIGKCESRVELLRQSYGQLGWDGAE